MGYTRLPIMGGGGSGGTSTDITNLSSVAGATVTDALNNSNTTIVNVSNVQQVTQYKPQEPITLSATDIVNKYVVLSSAPTTKNITQVFVVGGTIQTYGDDFIVTSDDSDRRLSWSGLGLEPHIAENDMIIVIYN